MMYGFGDVKSPADDTVAVLEEIALEYMTEMVSKLRFLVAILCRLSHQRQHTLCQTRKAIRVNGRPGKVETQDIVFLIRRDAKKVCLMRLHCSHSSQQTLSHLRLIVCAN
jgi:hypothetical protein